MDTIPYGPFDVPHRVKMGLAVLAPDESWIEVDGDYARDLREKRRLLATERARVLGVLPGSEPAQREVRELVARQLIENHPALVRVQGRRLDLLPLGEQLALDDASDSAIEGAARLVQEDLCIMERNDAGWCLTAAAVCFPTRWDMPSKLGLPLATIHDPVPGYERVAASADRFFDVLAPGSVFRRANWSLLDDATLFQPAARRVGAPSDAIDAHNAGDTVWLRVERQTLQRLAGTGAILFTIRIHRAPLRVLARDPAAAAAFAASVRSMDADLARYKALGVVRDAALAYLDAASAPDPNLRRLDGSAAREGLP
jgi:hypothetical protein